jgi:glycerol-1-phosphate dehydrogenase [NAD(P)+]
MTEQTILQASPAELAGLSYDCGCGHAHGVDIQTIRTGREIAGDVAAFVSAHHPKARVVVVSDTNTAAAQGDAVAEALADAGLLVSRHTFVTEGAHFLVPDETAVGALLTGLPRDTGLIVGAGSGTINDLCRFVADRMKIPYLIVCTAPSVDGYASTVSPLILAGHKTTLEACYPEAVFADPDVLKAAPAALLQAGFGDLLGKLTALTDWDLARRLNGEYHCPVIEGMVRRALAVSTAQAAGIAARDAEACTNLFDALLLSGLAMGMVGNSRPASGAEHHLAHFWEMDALAKGEEHALHGNAVGAATPVVARLYALMADLLPERMPHPDAAEIQQLLRQAGAADSPRALGISREVFHRSLLEAMHIRPRFTILRFAADHGRLAALAEQLTTEFYGA